MTRSIVTLAVLACMVFAVTLSGCQTQQPQQITRADIVRLVNGAQLALDLGLTLAEMRGADAATIDTAREHSMLAFAVMRDALAVDLGDLDRDKLAGALEQLRLVAGDVLALCEGVGVNEVRLQAISLTVDRAFFVLSQVVAISGERL